MNDKTKPEAQAAGELPADVQRIIDRDWFDYVDASHDAQQPVSAAVNVSWADFWIAQGDWSTANDFAAFEKAERWLLAQQPAVVGDGVIYIADFEVGDYDSTHSAYQLRPGESVPAGCTAFRALTPAATLEDAGVDDESDREPCEVCLDRRCNGECGGDQ